MMPQIDPTKTDFQPTRPAPGPTGEAPLKKRKSTDPIVCAISGELPQEPVISLKSGHVFDKRLIERALEASNNRCPETGQSLTTADLLAFKKTSVIRNPPLGEVHMPKSFAAAMHFLQEEWDRHALEYHQIESKLIQTNKELATALYRFNTAERLVATLEKDKKEFERKEKEWLVKEKEWQRKEKESESRENALKAVGREYELKNTQPLESTPTQNQPTIAQEMAIGKNANTKLDDAHEHVAIPEKLPTTLPASLLETAAKKNSELQTKRKARVAPPEQADNATIQSFTETAALKVDGDDIGITSIALVQEGKAYVGTTSGMVWSVNVDHMKPFGRGHCMAHMDVSGGVRRVRWDAANGRMLSAGADGLIKVWDESREVAKLENDAGVADFDLHTVGGVVICMLEDGRWAWRDLGVCGKIVCHGRVDKKVVSGSVHPDGLVFAMGTVDGIVELWDARNMRKAVCLGNNGDGPVRAIEMSEKGYYVATAIGDSVKLWDLRKSLVAGNVDVVDAHGVCIDGLGYYGCAVGTKSVRIFAAKKKCKELSKATFDSVQFGGADVFRMGCAWGPNAKCLLVGDRRGGLHKFSSGLSALSTHASNAS